MISHLAVQRHLRLQARPMVSKVTYRVWLMSDCLSEKEKAVKATIKLWARARAGSGEQSRLS